MKLLRCNNSEELRKEYREIAGKAEKNETDIRRLEEIRNTLHQSPLGSKLADQSHLQTAFIYASRSFAVRRQVGCAIVKDDSVISIGYNGTDPGESNICEDHEGMTLPCVKHAERNAIDKVIEKGREKDLVGATLYVTDAPCPDCAKRIINSKIKRVVYSIDYRLTEGLDSLRRAGVKVDKIDIALEES